jgi:hypothetical protein
VGCAAVGGNRRVLAYRTRRGERRLAYVCASYQYGVAPQSQQDRLTGFADGLLATGQAESVDGQFATDGTSQLQRDVVGVERAAHVVSASDIPPTSQSAAGPT